MASRIDDMLIAECGSPKELLEFFLRILDDIQVPDVAQLDLRTDLLREEAHAYLFRLERNGRGSLVTVLLGPSGGGKSSLFNALTGHEHSHTSSIERPATKGAVCAIPHKLLETLTNVLFPTLIRSVPQSKLNQGKIGEVTFIGSESEQKLIIIDSPDYDTRFDMNREVARRLSYWADVIVMVTNVERYADRSTASEFESIKSWGTPIVAVLNRVAGDIESLTESYESELKKIGISPLCVVAIEENPNGIDESATSVQLLQKTIETQSPRTHVELRNFSMAVESSLLPQVLQWRTDCERLAADLQSMENQPNDLISTVPIGTLEEIEEASKFWLRYSPRGVLKGVKTLLSKPSDIFRKATLPSTPDEESLGIMVRNQAWDSLESLQIRTREAMQKHRPGRIFLSDAAALSAAELTRQECDDLFEELANDLVSFAKTRLESARREWNDHKLGPVAKARFWAVDKVLRLLTLGLTLAVLPPLAWELFRFIGHAGFTNEVTKEFERARNRFESIMKRTVTDQLSKYSTAIDALGTSAAASKDLCAIVERLREFQEEARA